MEGADNTYVVIKSVKISVQILAKVKSNMVANQVSDILLLNNGITQGMSKILLYNLSTQYKDLK